MGANLVTINPITLLLLQTLEYFRIEKDGELRIGTFTIVLDETVPVDTLFVSHYDPMFETLKKSNMVLTLEEEKIEKAPESLNGFNSSFTLASNYSEIKMKFLLIGSDEHTEALENPNIRVVTEDLLTQEITILNYPY